MLEEWVDVSPKADAGIWKDNVGRTEPRDVIFARHTDDPGDSDRANGYEREEAAELRTQVVNGRHEFQSTKYQSKL
ncbi:MAG: hypothetical protein A2X67_09420 [Ignavibacteria bacterium GWA2_55_11]|nr:MAG: hypothetical protein A2X67_09420 [Ignavibacteria bacterium GWA2_55_11]OGU46536.1 MAG: hypothetical protein A2X68_01250 [Ignavibacteria bacterium GWC2_56_12]OGU62354.1 MAG: hypothetical protein A3C56_05015 [Ignavibacteria bacterium RIFCSPHIGHO2_02_FULL_56_12]OGU74370.1 MAG: hypothetical protein A3G43_01770 [Ignavibacteria bacterium RIFCSPLOWO2_12_FULL_56_21]OGU75294.1 MAG: hypothetical protein A3H45_02695 [Ignavibacteria bacterium RIFCSPLOWO2_02_FULL_55_14]